MPGSKDSSPDYIPTPRRPISRVPRSNEGGTKFGKNGNLIPKATPGKPVQAAKEPRTGRREDR